jgi:hypothetical protein
LTKTAHAAVPVPLRGLHLGVLYALAVSQPLLNLLGNNADFFTSRQLTSGKVLWFALVVGLGIPLVLYAIDTLAGILNPRAGWLVHLVLLFALALLLTAQISRKVISPSAGAILLAAILAGLVTLAYARSVPLRQIVSYFSPLPALVLLLFLFNTPAHRIVFPGSTAAANVAVKGHVPVVFVSFDEFTGTSLLDNSNRIDPKLYPNYAAFTKDATYYRNFTAAADETTRVMAGLMTGDMWHEKALPIAADYPRNLFTLFGRSYRMKVGEEATDLCPVKLCHQTGASSSSVFSDAALVFLHQISPKPLEKKLTPVNETLGKFEDADADAQLSSNDTPAEAAANAKKGVDNNREHGRDTILNELGGGGRPSRYEQWLRTIDGKVDRTLYFKHVLLPHVPWQYLPDGRMYRKHAQEYIAGVTQLPSFGDKWLLEQGYQRHLMQVAFTDRMVGQLIARLKQTGIYDKALIVITADNGESFLHPHHDRHIADAVTFTDIASTPLFIKLPGQKKGGYDDRHVRTFDVVPTIADAAGLTMPWKVIGRSILKTRVPDAVAVYREQGKKGEVFRTSLADYEKKSREAIARKTALFRAGLYGLGPNPDLIGKTVASLAPKSLGSLRGRVNAEIAGLLAKVDTKSSFLPANVTGRISGSGARPGIPLALALNGKVVAVGWSAMLKGDKHVYFTFLAPPTAFVDGSNRAEVFAVGGSGSLQRISG